MRSYLLTFSSFLHGKMLQAYETAFSNIVARNQYTRAAEIVRVTNQNIGCPHQQRNVRGRVSTMCWRPIQFLAKKLRSPLYSNEQSHIGTRHSTFRCSECGNGSHAHRTPWTMAMGFYAACGGLIRAGMDGIPKTFTVTSLLHVARSDPSALSGLQHQQVMDMSKSSGLTKTITCMQVFWFCASCLARLCDHKAISLLELITFAHCVCALIVYLLWWHKPYDVTSHTTISPEICDFEHLMSQCRDLRGCDNHRTERTDTLSLPGPLSAYIKAYEESSTVCQVLLGSEYTVPPIDVHRIRHGEFIPGTGFYLHNPLHPEQDDTSTNDDDRYIYLVSHQRLNVWQNLWFLLERRPTMQALLNLSDNRRSEKLFVNRIGNLDDGTINFWNIMSGGLAVGLYGCLHILAWDYAFSSSAETHLWQAATIVTIAFGSVIFFGIILYRLILTLGSAIKIKVCLLVVCRTADANELFKNSSLDRFRRVYQMICACVLLFFPSFNLIARAYLVIESFVTVPNSPPSVYQMPDWTVYIPHI